MMKSSLVLYDAAYQTVKILTSFFEEDNMFILKLTSSSPDLSSIQTLRHQIQKKDCIQVHKVKDEIQQI